MPGALDPEPLTAELLREGVADPLQSLGVGARRDEGGNSGFRDCAEVGPRLAGQPAAVGAAHALREVLGKRPLRHVLRARQSQELAQRGGLCSEALDQEFIAEPLELLDLRVVLDEAEEGRLDQGQRPDARRSAPAAISTPRTP